MNGICLSQFLRRTLSADRTEAEAVKYFDEQFSAAVKKKWTTSVNNFMHQAKQEISKVV
jgi:hypothetical protein